MTAKHSDGTMGEECRVRLLPWKLCDYMGAQAIQEQVPST